MQKFRLLISLIVFFGALGACSSEEEPIIYTLPVDEPSNQKQEKIDYFQQNLEYSNLYIQNALDEKPDAQVLSLLQKDKQQADRELREAQKQVSKNEQEVARLERRKAELEGQTLEGQRQEGAKVENQPHWQVKILKLIKTLNLVEQNKLRKRLSELTKVIEQLQQARVDLSQAEQARDKASIKYQKAATNYADYSAQIKIKVDRLAELEGLSDEALIELYSTL